MPTFPSGSGGFLNPNQIVNELDVAGEAMVVADFGCGHGYFSIPLAEKVGDTGKIFAIDILQDALQTVEAKAEDNHISNIETIRANLEKINGSNLEDNSCDVVWLVNILFQTDEDEVVIKEAQRVLKEGGKIVFIDWHPEVEFGPQGKRVNPQEMKSLMKKEGLSFVKNFGTDKYHFGMIFEKK